MNGNDCGEKGVVSIIVPLYRVFDYIGEAIDSLKAQTYTQFECLCLDDGSGNEMTEVVRNKIAGDERFRLYEFENAGMAEGRNRGLNLAKGEYVTFLDQDDGFHPRFLEEMVGALERSGADCAICMFDPVTEPCTVAAWAAAHLVAPAWVLLDDPAKFVLETADRDIYNVWQKVFRRSSLKGLRFRRDLFGADDACFTAETFLQFRRVVFTATELHFYRQHGASVTSQQSSRYTESKLRLASVVAPLVPETLRASFCRFALREISRAVKDALRYRCTRAERRRLALLTGETLRVCGLSLRMWPLGARWRYLKLRLKAMV